MGTILDCMFQREPKYSIIVIKAESILTNLYIYVTIDVITSFTLTHKYSSYKLEFKFKVCIYKISADRFNVVKLSQYILQRSLSFGVHIYD